MANRSQTKLLTAEEISRPFQGEWADRFPPILSHELAAKLLGIATSTLYEWKSEGRLTGCFRKRGKRTFFWRDKLIDSIFNGKEWT